MELNAWHQYFLNHHSLSHDEVNELMLYASNLVKKKLPIIYDLKHLALLTGINETTMEKIIFCNEKYYRTFTIPKKGEKDTYRSINTPYPSLKYIQDWIKKHLLSHIDISEAAHGFYKQRSILTNAKRHKESNVILNVDIKDFFPSIHQRRILGFFKSLGYTKKVSFYLSSLCCLNSSLPQGSPTSPILSNIITKHLDKRLNGYCEKKNLIYTRYADDITISSISEELPPDLFCILNYIILDEGFVLNKKKTRLAYKCKHKRIVTGIIIDEKGNLRPPRWFREKVKQEAYFIQKHGLIDHLNHLHSKGIKQDISAFNGKIAFWKMISPQDKELQKIIMKLGLEAIYNRMNR